jgi:hypothetical protein
MELQRQLAMSFLDVFFGSVASDAKRLVKVFCHGLWFEGSVFDWSLSPWHISANCSSGSKWQTERNPEPTLRLDFAGRNRTKAPRLPIWPYFSDAGAGSRCNRT